MSGTKHISEIIDEAAVKRGRELERADVIALLREWPGDTTDEERYILEQAAEAIEDGRHVGMAEAAT